MDGDAAGTKLGMGRGLLVLSLAALALGPGLGGSGRLTYHEAIWAETGREMLATGDWLVPRLAGQPWLEKPPLGTWLIAASGWLGRGVSETAARAPSAIAGAILALGVAIWAGRRFHPTIGFLAGAAQATSFWLVMRGRLAEADVPLAALIALALWTFDVSRTRPGWRWLFFALIGATALAKGIGFGAALIAAAIGLVLLWDRDRLALRALNSPAGWIVVALVALPWPILVLARYPGALRLWAMHIFDRLATKPAHFSGEPWWQYILAFFWQTLPWTPLALVGAWHSLRRAIGERGGPDRFLWCWAVGPALLVSLASVKNAHYLIHSFPPWAVWSALGLTRLACRLRERGWTPNQLRLGAIGSFVGLALIYGLGFLWVGPWFDRRGAEWAFYEQAGRVVDPAEPLELLYDPDDHTYPALGGPIPHDLAVRLFYLNRPARWQVGVPALLQDPSAPPGESFAVIARDGDLPRLGRLGRVEILGHGPTTRVDRSYVLVRIRPIPAVARDIPSRAESGRPR